MTYCHTLSLRDARPIYRELGVPNNLDGRFEAIVLHLVLVLRRLKRDFPAGRDLAEALQESFFEDMDHSLRELGAGDLGVGKRVKRMAEGFMGRLAGYEGALDRLAVAGEAASSEERRVGQESVSTCRSRWSP